MKLQGIWLSSLLLLACAPIIPTRNVQWVDIMVYPHVKAHSQTIVANNSLSSIATLSLTPYVETTANNYAPISSVTGVATAEGSLDSLCLTQTAPTIDPARPFVLRRMKPNCKYRIFARAYDASNILISKDSGSYVDVQVGTNDAPAITTIPLTLMDVPFSATTSITVRVDGRCDYLKTSLYLVAGNAQVGLAMSTRAEPEVLFGNLQADTDYRVVAEAYKGQYGAVASNSLTFHVANDNSLATMSLPLVVPYYITTVAGNGTAGYSAAQDGGAATNASLNCPDGIGLDAYGNIYIAEYQNHRIRKVDVNTGVITTVAGNGVAGYNAAQNGGPAISANLNSPRGLTLDTSGNLFIADEYNHLIRKVDKSTGIITTIAGNGVAGYNAAHDGGPAINATLNFPTSVALDGVGGLYISDYHNNRIRKVDLTTGIITTVAGNGAYGYSAAQDGGPATSASLAYSYGVTVDSARNIYIADLGNQRIRKVSASGTITTVAGNGSTGYSLAQDGGSATNAALNNPYGVAVDAFGNLYIADHDNCRVRKVSRAGIITTIAGSGVIGYNAAHEGGGATSASLSYPHGLALDTMGFIYMGDSYNHRVRKLK